ncbi:cytochrome P450 [Lizonia empirigonia]|nr:cytochrome P450 [Lizonia empirigonia]
MLVYLLAWTVYSRTLHPLARVPGPIWPSLSRTWLMNRMYKGDCQLVQAALHKKYGPLIRIAPNELSYSSPDGVPIIYRFSEPLEKTDWYHAFRAAGLKSQVGLFTITNEKKHTAYRRVIGGVYSLTDILKNEDGIDQNVTLLLNRLDGFVSRNEDVDLGLWLEMYAYDNVGSVFFGKPFGFLETSSDYEGHIAAVYKAMPLLSFVSMAPSYAQSALLIAAAAIPSLLRAVVAVDDIRKTAVRETAEAMARTSHAQRHDLLTRLLQIVEEKGEKTGVTHHEVTGEMWAAVIAGADSTAGGLRSVFYHLIKHPSVLAKLTAEIDSAYANNTLTHPVQYSQVTTLPYLVAVCKEAARIWPSFQFVMPRYAPAQGLQLPNGFLVPAGYRVGINPYVVQRDTSLFGEDAETFRPERWLEADADQLRKMNAAMLVFEAGTRTCTGQHLTTAEIYKIVPELLRRFTINMPPEREWKTFNASFNLTSGVICEIKQREIEKTL